MSDRASAVHTTPPSSIAADTQYVFRQLIQHNSNSFQTSPVQGLDDILYINGQEHFQHGLSPNIAIGAASGDFQYDMKHPQFCGYGSHEPSPAPSTMSPPLNERRTRSGQVINRAIRRLKPSPKQTNQAASPKSKAKKVKNKKKIKAENRIARLKEPLSVLMGKWAYVPVVDIDAYVNRSPEIRRQEIEEGKNPGKVKRPMNSFMLYRKAYQNRIMNWCLQNNHQVVSQVCGDSWPLEPDNVQAQFNEWARIERQNHQNAHPGYKFSPAKAGTAKAAKRKASVSKELRLEDYDWEGGRSTRAVNGQRLTPQPSHTRAEFQTQPYYRFGYDLRGSSMEPGMAGIFPSSACNPSKLGSDVPINPNGEYWRQRVVPSVQYPNTHNVILRETRGPGTNAASHPAYQQEYDQQNGAISGGIAQHFFNEYQDEPEVKIDPFMGHDKPCDYP